MKKIIVSLAIFAGSLGASTTQYVVGPATLAGWKVSGVDRAQLIAASTFSLPAGVEVVRSFNGGLVLVHSISNPTFGATPEEWPILQVGPMAFALAKEGEWGYCFVLVGDEVTRLNGKIALDQQGRPLAPVELLVGVDPEGKVGVVAHEDDLQAFALILPTAAVEVALTSGASEAWPHESLGVTVVDDASQTKASDRRKEADVLEKIAAIKALAEKDQALSLASLPQPASEKAKAEAAPSRQPRRSTRLEIYTPPAHRPSAAAIRQAIAAAKK